MLILLRVQKFHNLLLLIKSQFIVKLSWYLRGLINSSGRVFNTYFRIKFEVDEFLKLNVEFKEIVHDAVVNIKGKLLCELIRHNPCYQLSHYFYLIVYSFDAQKHFSKAFAECAIKHELVC